MPISVDKAKEKYVKNVVAAATKQCKHLAEFLGIPESTACASRAAKHYQAFATETNLKAKADLWYERLKDAYSTA